MGSVEGVALEDTLEEALKVPVEDYCVIGSD